MKTPSSRHRVRRLRRREFIFNSFSKNNARCKATQTGLVVEPLEDRLVLSTLLGTVAETQTIYYDYLEEGVLRGGRIEVDVPTVFSSANFGRMATSWDWQTIWNQGASDNRVDVVFVGDGYTAAEIGTYASQVESIVSGFFAESPLDTYRNFFNVHRVDVISNESGVDNDTDDESLVNTPQLLRDTALDMGFWSGGLQRRLGVDVGKAQVAAGTAPAVDQILAVANSIRYGGAGGSDLATVSGGNVDTVELALHEFGHSFADLSDEYFDVGSGTFPGQEADLGSNVSTYDTDEMTRRDAKWFRWLTEPNVGTFEGARYHEFGIYRPTDNSKMRNLRQPFEQVNAEQFVMAVYADYVDPIDDATPAGRYAQDAEFFVDPVDPLAHNLDIDWYLDDVAIPGANGKSFDASSLNVPAGTYELSVQVVDNTDLVRDDDFRQQHMTERREWTLSVELPVSDQNVFVSTGWGGRKPDVGSRYGDEDILTYDLATETWSLHFDGGDVGITGDVNGIHIANDDSILISFNAVEDVPGLGMVAPADIVRFVPRSLGDNTQGTFEWYVDGSDVGLDGEDIDAIGFTPDGLLVISMSRNNLTLPGGLTGHDEDFFVRNDDGTWQLYFDGSDVNAGFGDFNGVWIDPSNNDMYLTTFERAFAVDGLTGDWSDIIVAVPTQLSEDTAADFRVFRRGNAIGLGPAGKPARVDAVALRTSAEDTSAARLLSQRSAAEPAMVPERELTGTAFTPMTSLRSRDLHRTSEQASAAAREAEFVATDLTAQYGRKFSRAANIATDTVLASLFARNEESSAPVAPEFDFDGAAVDQVWAELLLIN